jgi:hypothetical protein
LRCPEIEKPVSDEKKRSRDDEEEAAKPPRKMLHVAV